MPEISASRIAPLAAATCLSTSNNAFPCSSFIFLICSVIFARSAASVVRANFAVAVAFISLNWSCISCRNAAASSAFEMSVTGISAATFFTLASASEIVFERSSALTRVLMFSAYSLSVIASPILFISFNASCLFSVFTASFTSITLPLSSFIAPVVLSNKSYCSLRVFSPISAAAFSSSFVIARCSDTASALDSCCFLSSAIFANSVAFFICSLNFFSASSPASFPPSFFSFFGLSIACNWSSNFFRCPSVTVSALSIASPIILPCSFCCVLVKVPNVERNVSSRACNAANSSVAPVASPCVAVFAVFASPLNALTAVRVASIAPRIFASNSRNSSFFPASVSVFLFALKNSNIFFCAAFTSSSVFAANKPASKSFRTLAKSVLNLVSAPPSKNDVSLMSRKAVMAISRFAPAIALPVCSICFCKSAFDAANPLSEASAILPISDTPLRLFAKDFVWSISAGYCLSNSACIVSSFFCSSAVSLDFPASA